eukprot:10668048-Alexandrium_andersonii.AAC.1
MLLSWPCSWIPDGCRPWRGGSAGVRRWGAMDGPPSGKRSGAWAAGRVAEAAALPRQDGAAADDDATPAGPGEPGTADAMLVPIESDEE